MSCSSTTSPIAAQAASSAVMRSPLWTTIRGCCLCIGDLQSLSATAGGSRHTRGHDPVADDANGTENIRSLADGYKALRRANEP